MTEIWSLDALCRCCHADGDFKDLRSVYVFDNGPENYLNMLLETLGVTIKPPSVNASYSICDACILHLRSAANFKKKVLECETKFEEYCKNELSQTNYDIKTEPEYLGK
ncbi:uncharacterized protein LOC134660420 [Cydia amplana]|uniref:uncharacterized protein LOC134660420 n=1 Tax=Cydia amplana TaxID=1869771 RepID=UPI002FE66A43